MKEYLKKCITGLLKEEELELYVYQKPSFIQKILLKIIIHGIPNAYYPSEEEWKYGNVISFSILNNWETVNNKTATYMLLLIMLLRMNQKSVC